MASEIKGKKEGGWGIATSNDSKTMD